MNYTSVCIDAWFRPVEDLAEMREDQVTQVAVGLHGSQGLRGYSLGTAELRRLGKFNLHTESVFLRTRFRKKGHGLALYLALIYHAKRLGAKRLYSSTRLNKHSNRMWSKKLRDIGLDVKECKFRHTCYRCRHRSMQPRYYVELDYCPAWWRNYEEIIERARRRY